MDQVSENSAAKLFDKAAKLANQAVAKAETGDHAEVLRLLDEASQMIAGLDDERVPSLSVYIRLARAESFWEVGRQDESRQLMRDVMVETAPGGVAPESDFCSRAGARLATWALATQPGEEVIKIGDEFEALVFGNSTSPWDFKTVSQFYELTLFILFHAMNAAQEDGSDGAKEAEADMRPLLVELARRLTKANCADPLGFFLAAKTAELACQFNDLGYNEEALEVINTALVRAEAIFTERKPAPEAEFDSGFFGDCQRYGAAVAALKSINAVPRPINWLRYLKAELLAETGATEEAFALCERIHREFLLDVSQQGNVEESSPDACDEEEEEFKETLVEAFGGSFNVTFQSGGNEGIEDVPAGAFYTRFIELAADRVVAGKLDREACLALVPHAEEAIEDTADSDEEEEFTQRVNAALAKISQV